MNRSRLMPNQSKITMGGHHLLAVIALAYFLVTGSAEARPNFLFLVADDMRPELSSYYGPDFPSPVHPMMYTPNLDRLAARSLLLKRAYVQQAVCSPSRTSLLTGRRPDTTHVYDLVHYFRKVGGNFTTVPQYFKQHGYHSVGMGKIFHPGSASGDDDPISWSEPYFHAPDEKYWREKKHSWMAIPARLRYKHPLPDDQIADHAVHTLGRAAKRLATDGQPFFVAVGFHKPHLPFIFPEEFLTRYPREEIHVPDNQFAPVGMPPVAWSSYGELRSYHDVARLNVTGDINSTIPAGKVRELRRAYYSALSYTDSLIGRVLGELEHLGLANNTVVSFWGDHGWQLGEHGEWAKHTNFELATHAPMMVSIPGVTDSGVVTEALTEFVDLFPTLVDAAGLPPLPLCPENSSAVVLCREGSSLMPLIHNPTRPWKSRVFSQYPRDDHRVMGYTMRTDRFRYTEWAEFHGEPAYRPDWGNLTGVELYDHQNDPEENVNQAHNSAYHGYRTVLSHALHAGWRAALP